MHFRIQANIAVGGHVTRLLASDAGGYNRCEDIQDVQAGLKDVQFLPSGSNFRNTLSSQDIRFQT